MVTQSVIQAIMSERTCGEACWEAREDICRCSCGGRNHGIYRTTGTRPERTRKLNGYRYQLVAVAVPGSCIRNYILDKGKRQRVEWGRCIFGEKKDTARDAVSIVGYLAKEALSSLRSASTQTKKTEASVYSTSIRLWMAVLHIFQLFHGALLLRLIFLVNLRALMPKYTNSLKYGNSSRRIGNAQIGFLGENSLVLKSIMRSSKCSS